MQRLFLTNSLTRAKEAFAPQDPNRVTMYVCGPTVYNYAHIGNARPVVVFDVLFRLLRHLFGPDKVVYARNITDIDDRIIEAHRVTGEPITEITRRYAAIYQADMRALGALDPTYQPYATDHVPGMIDMIERLVDRGNAYPCTSGVNFHVPSMADYGKLARRDRDEQIVGARGDPATDKRDPADFALWKAAKPGEPFWESPWGRGRPGWHIECSVMAAATLGETLDIHGGGIDLLFPHHENEIAQSECANARPLARYWLHNGFLDMSGEKMSKSLGNVLLVHDLAASWPGEVLRFALMSAHYRAPLDWTPSLLEQCRITLDGWYRALARLSVVDAQPSAPETVVEALCDDLNTPRAIAAVAGLVTEANKAGADTGKRAAKAALLGAGALLGLLQQDPVAWLRGGHDDADTARIDALVEARVAARKAKDWAKADQLRNQLTDLNVVVEDGPQGSTWRFGGQTPR